MRRKASAILDWIQEAKEKLPPSKIDDYFDNSFRMSGSARKNSPYASAFPVRSDDGELAHGALALPVDGETDTDGRFQFNLLGANRLAILEFEGPNIAKCYVHVVTRNMEAVSAQPLETFGVRAGNVLRPRLSVRCGTDTTYRRHGHRHRDRSAVAKP